MDTDWLKLWSDLIAIKPHSPDSEPMKRYRAHASQKQQRPDPLLDFVLDYIDRRSTVLDIGAGDGRWTIPLAQKADAVCAVDPNEEMLKFLRENAETAKVNIQIIQSSWEEAVVDSYDIAVCAHAMYSSSDLALFVNKMNKHAEKACFMALRLPPADGIIGELSNAIYSRSHDSANAVIAYNALYSMGIYSNILVENETHFWVNNTIEEAFIRAKRHLNLESVNTHDKLIRDTLNKRLNLSNNCYVWPDGMRSALLWWCPDHKA